MSMFGDGRCPGFGYERTLVEEETNLSVVTTTQRRVLVVDDEPSEREGLAKLVGRLGYQVEVAESAEAAVQLVEAFRPAVVISDLMLPGIDGLELLQQLKGMTEPPAVLLITGHASIESAVEAMRR